MKKCGLRISAIAIVFVLWLGVIVLGHRDRYAFIPPSATTEEASADGEMLFWDSSVTKWTYTESTELFWDDVNKRLGIGTATPQATVDVNGFTMLGSDTTKIKMKKLTGTTGGTEGDQTNITHGLDRSKIIGCQVLVTAANNNRILPAFIEVDEYEYSVFIDATNVRIDLHATNSNSIRSGAITVLLTYEE